VEPIAAENDVYWDWSLQPVKNMDGEVSGLLLCLIDVTRRRHAQQELNRYAQELERSNQELEDFAYIASHDLQEPLRKIQTFGTRLLDLQPDAPIREGVDYIQRMVSASRRMQSLIDALLAYSRVTTTARPLKPVDLDDVGKDAITNLEARIRERDASVRVKGLPSIEADPVQMLQLFQNLIGNALKFSRGEVKTDIRISAEVLPLQGKEPEGGDGEPVCEIRVTDNGIGFDEKYLQRIFEPLQRLHGRNEYDGVGMGLAICKKIVERHGGSLTAESIPGRGSTFIVRLPLRQGVEKPYGYPTDG
jgi:light-regulated signal transduction histidine kinase (bacteriophytochrome)